MWKNFFAIVLSHHAQLQKLTKLNEPACRVLYKIQQIHLKTRKPYTGLLLWFTFKTLTLLLAESYSIVRHILLLSPESHNCPIPILIWVLYVWIISLLPDVVFGLVLIFRYHFHLLNQITSEILVDAKSMFATESHREVEMSFPKRSPHPDGIRMQICCDLSDRLDEVAVLHQELVFLTCLANSAVSVQILIWTVWSVTLFVIKLFLEYFLVAVVLGDETKGLDMDLFFGLLISLTTTFLSVACLASACSQTMCEVKFV